MSIFGDLTAEQDRIEAILDGYNTDAWMSPSAAVGWTITDVVLHLAQTEEAVVASAAGRRPAFAASPESTVDELVDKMVRTERAEPSAVFERWRAARRAGVEALREADPEQRLPWVTSPLKPGTLATTRLAEHWAHGLDITEPFDVPFADTDRLAHIAWLGHRTLGYAFGLAGQQAHEVFCELTGPTGATWRYGPPDAASTITGPASAFCRVGARRLTPDDSGLITSGPHGTSALRLLRNWAR
ncbi:maleylpyruvate isomerase family mycothiol-dependent enzyme [Mycobacterium intracellulare]|uniref:maleylpyruvate isomerase family mycothiol-dependent enzyme n=1 Tax=Mycobacterium intracellulare TaxID=1767 RepID=UPI00109E54C3|nr:maleylpyruvate isomerase family mycothiol-dependent enzyme [Mycobacterium intracellulare]